MDNKDDDLNGVVLKHTDEAYGEPIVCPEFITGELGNSEVEYVVSYENASTGNSIQDVSGQGDRMIEDVRMIVKQIHEKRIHRKQYYMNKCKAGDATARMALLIFFDTEYKNGEFITNREANPCRFISDRMAEIID